jgi:hypothetical protein
MNFLFHRALALRDTGSELAGVGAMLPDLWRMSHRRARADRGLCEAALALEGPLAGAGDGEAGEVVRGVLHHLEVDAWFHRHAVFLEGERHAALALRQRALAPRMGLFAHVLWELCLDGALVRREGEALVARLARALALVVPALSSEAARLTLTRHDELDREALTGRVARIAAELARGPWVLGYAEGRGVAFAVSEIRRRMGLEALSAEAQAGLAELCDGELGLRATRVADELLAEAPPAPTRRADEHGR